MRAAGVMVSSASGFTVEGSAAPGALRLALGGEVEAERTLEGVRVVAEVIAGIGAGAGERPESSLEF